MQKGRSQSTITDFTPSPSFLFSIPQKEKLNVPAMTETKSSLVPMNPLPVTSRPVTGTPVSSTLAQPLPSFFTEVGKMTGNDNLVKLTAVGLKEASCDSPSFRAFINYADSAVVEISSSFIDMIQFFKNNHAFSLKLASLADDFNAIFKPLSQDNHSSTVMINKDITRKCVDDSITGSNIIFDTLIDITSVDVEQIKRMETLISADFKDYFEWKRQFDATQEKYDSYVQKFLSLPKSYPPEKAKEDSFQLFEIRKQYLYLSLNLYTVIEKLKVKISGCIVDTCNSSWSKTSSPKVREVLNVLGLSRIQKNMKRLQHCANLYCSKKTLIGDLLRTRVDLEEVAVRLVQPSTNLKSYSPGVLNNSNIYDSDPDCKSLFEKHGWVYIKSTVFGSKEIVWARRWLFIKDEVFGFLNIAPNGMFVQEGDKVGVLLANFRFTPEEDRKFCFEIKTYQASLTIQVETLKDLRTWLTVFKNVKLRCLENDIDSASSKYEPVIEGLRLTPTITKDFELISTTNPLTSQSESVQIINRKLPTLTFSSEIDCPLPNQMTDYSTLTQMYLSPCSTPSAKTANFWGYINWGLYFIDDGPKKKTLKRNGDVINLKYPDYYPDTLRFHDIQLRSVYEAYIPANELTLMHFKASWAPNSHQELFCNIYVTNNNFYQYSNNNGLIFLLPIPVTNLLSVEVVEKENYDVLHLHLVNGLSIKMKLFAETSFAVRDQINFITRNKASDNPQPLESVLKKLQNIKQEFETLLSYERTANDIQISPIRQEFDKTIVTVSAAADLSYETKLNYTDRMELLTSKKYDIPAKALFHILVGDESFLIQHILPVSSTPNNSYNAKQSIWRCNKKRELVRVIRGGNVALIQRIEKMVHNKYYNIVQIPQILNFPLGVSATVELRFIISSLNSNSCRLISYYRFNSPCSGLAAIAAKYSIEYVLKSRMGRLDEEIKHLVVGLKNEKRIVSASIKQYGPITTYNSDEPSKDEETFKEISKDVKYGLLINAYWKKIEHELNKLNAKTFDVLCRLCCSIITVIQLHSVILSLLLVSVLYNIFLSGRSTYNYWSAKNVIKYVDHVSSERNIMQRSISVKEIEELVTPNKSVISYNSSGSECFRKFNDNSQVSNIIDRAKDTTLITRLVSIRVKRNELLSELNLLNSFEKNFLLEEWKNWVLSEFQTCEMVKTNYSEKYDNQIENYCESVNMEIDYMYSNLL